MGLTAMVNVENRLLTGVFRHFWLNPLVYCVTKDLETAIDLATKYGDEFQKTPSPRRREPNSAQDAPRRIGLPPSREQGLIIFTCRIYKNVISLSHLHPAKWRFAGTTELFLRMSTR